MVLNGIKYYPWLHLVVPMETEQTTRSTGQSSGEEVCHPNLLNTTRIKCYTGFKICETKVWTVDKSTFSWV